MATAQSGQRGGRTAASRQPQARAETSLSIDCYQFCRSKDVQQEGKCKFGNCNQSGLEAVNTSDIDTIIVYPSGPIVIPFFVGIQGQPQEILLDVDAKWRTASGDVLARPSFEQDSIQDAGDGRHWEWWMLYFWLDNVSQQNTPIFFSAGVDEVLSGASTGFDLANSEEAVAVGSPIPTNARITTTGFSPNR